MVSLQCFMLTNTKHQLPTHWASNDDDVVVQIVS